MANLRLGLLGSLQVMADSGPVTTLESDRVRALLAYLAVECDHPHRRDALVGLLWPDTAEEVARRNLRQALYNLRQAIGDHTADPPYLLISRDEIQFNLASNFDLDVRTFISLLDTCEEHLPRCAEACPIHAGRLEQAIALYRGPFLNEFFLPDSSEFEEWAVRQREAQHRRALDALTYLANYSELGGQLQAAHHWAARLLELDPWREEAHRQLMRVLAAKGERSAALAQYETCRRTLTQELGVEPAAETRELYEEIRKGELEVRRTETRSATPWTPPSLPAQTTPFVGRERELERLVRLVRAPECRLLTLVGPGGIGKTRLALQTAAQVREGFKHGAAFVSLAPVESPAFIVTALADAVRFEFSGPADPKTQLWSYLREKEILFVLDNVEHLLGEGPLDADAAGLFVEMLEHLPRSKLLITSREPLNLQGEWVFEVEGLDAPKGDQDEAFENSDAVILFLRRAHRSHTAFALPRDERPAVLRICQLVGGMPLAIELAAAWIRTLTPAQIEREIERNLDFLATSLRDLPERHRSMRAVFDYSWRLLSGDEQRALARLSILRGGFEREAAGQIAGASLPLLSALLAKSFLRRMPSGRYDLHELVRQYAAERLAECPEEQEVTRNRHRDYYLGQLERCRQDLQSGRQREAIGRLTLDLDNLRVAWERAAEQCEVRALQQVAWPMFWYYELRNLLTEGETAFRQAGRGVPTEAMEPSERAAAEIARAHLQAFQAHFAHRRSDNAEAMQALEGSLEVLRRGADLAALADALWIYGTACWMAGELERAARHFDEALSLELELKRAWPLADGYISTGYVEFERGNYSEAESWLRRGLESSRELGDPTLTAFAIAGLCRVLKWLGHFAEMELLLREAYRLAQESGNRLAVGLSLEQLAETARVRGELTTAIRFCEECIALYRETGDEWSLSRALDQQGELELVAGAEAEARRSFVGALDIAFRGNYIGNMLDALNGIAALKAREGETAVALELVLRVLSDAGATSATKARAQELWAKLEPQLARAEIQAAEARVRGETLEEAALALLAGPGEKAAT